MAYVLLPPRLGCVLQSWSAPGRVESLQERTDLPLWTFLPCTPPWAVLQTHSWDGPALSPAPPSPGTQTSKLNLHNDETVVALIRKIPHAFFVNYSKGCANKSHQADPLLCLLKFATLISEKCLLAIPPTDTRWQHKAETCPQSVPQGGGCQGLWV